MSGDMELLPGRQQTCGTGLSLQAAVSTDAAGAMTRDAGAAGRSSLRMS
jgi:hypothetical protein